MPGISRAKKIVHARPNCLLRIGIGRRVQHLRAKLLPRRINRRADLLGRSENLGLGNDNANAPAGAFDRRIGQIHFFTLVHQQLGSGPLLFGGHFEMLGVAVKR